MSDSESIGGPSGAPLIGLVGPTATGKTELALAVAERAGAEIISVDSMLVYRGMDIGTAKPGLAITERVTHHVVDCAEPSERYDARRYLTDVTRACRTLDSRGVSALYSGGTGFYLKALTHGLFDGPPADLDLRGQLSQRAEQEGSPALHAELALLDRPASERIHPNDERRVIRALEVFRQTGRTLSDWQREWRDESELKSAGRPRRLIGLELDTAELDRRIARRTTLMMDAGWPEEARAIRAGVGFGPTARTALGYREVLSFVDGDITREELEALVVLRTRQFARRQRTWYRHYPDIKWIPAPCDDAAELARATDSALEHFGW